MPQVFENFRVVGSDDSFIVARFVDQAQWLDSPGDAANTIVIPDYTLFDATVSFDLEYLRPI